MLGLIQLFPDMSCMNTVYRVKIGVGPLVSSQEMWKLVVSLLERVGGSRTSWSRGSRVR